MSGEGTSSISAKIRRAADRFSKRLAAKDPELMKKLAKMKREKILTVIPTGFHSDSILEVTHRSAIRC